MLLPLLLVAWELSLPPQAQKIAEWMKTTGFSEEKGSAAAWKAEKGELVMLQDGDSTTIGTARGLPLSVGPETKVEFEVKVDELPAKGDLAHAKTEDAAFRLFLVFDEGGGLVTPPRTIGYAFASSGKAGDVVSSERFDTVKFLVVASAPAEKGKWTKITRNLGADYKQLFGASAKLPPLKAVALKSDANDTGGKARATLRSLKIMGPP